MKEKDADFPDSLLQQFNFGETEEASAEKCKYAATRKRGNESPRKITNQSKNKQMMLKQKPKTQKRKRKKKKKEIQRKRK